MPLEKLRCIYAWIRDEGENLKYEETPHEFKMFGTFNPQAINFMNTHKHLVDIQFGKVKVNKPMDEFKEYVIKLAKEISDQIGPCAIFIQIGALKSDFSSDTQDVIMATYFSPVKNIIIIMPKGAQILLE